MNNDSRDPPAGRELIHRSPRGDLLFLAGCLIALGVGLLAWARLDPEADIPRAAGGWLALGGAAGLIALGLAVSCAAVDTYLEWPRAIVRTRRWFFGLFRTSRTYSRSCFSAVVVAVRRVWTESSGSWTICNVFLVGPDARVPLGTHRSRGTAGGSPDDPRAARDAAHRLALTFARPLSLPVEIDGWGDTFPGEYSAFAESELSELSHDELVRCLRQVLAAGSAPAAAPVELNSDRKRSDSAVLVGEALARRGGPAVLAEVWAAETRDGDADWLAGVWHLGGDALDESLKQIEENGPPPRRRADPGGGFDWSGLEK